MMPMSFSPPSPNAGSDGKIGASQVFIILAVIVVAGAAITFGVQAIQAAMLRADEDRATQALCRMWVVDILAEAKQNPPDVGTYEAMLPANDSWGQPLTSVLIVEELENFARVRSYGRDLIFDTGDDHVFSKTDVHIRKSILKGITAGAHSAGKGLTSGVIEGLGEASLEKAKAGAKKVKTSLMDRFKKKEPQDEDD